MRASFIGLCSMNPPDCFSHRWRFWYFFVCRARPLEQPGLFLTWPRLMGGPWFSSPKTPPRTVLDLVWWQNAHLVAPCLTLGGRHCHQGWAHIYYLLCSRKGPKKELWQRWVWEIAVLAITKKWSNALMERPLAQHEVAGWSTSTRVLFIQGGSHRPSVARVRRKNDNGRGEVVDAAGGPLVLGFTDCDQGCRFVILAAGPSSVCLLACAPLQ